jgi:hypothetical protein
MPVIVADAQWDAIVTSQGRRSKMHKKLIANRPRNWLLALTSASCAKALAGKQLTDLESHLVKSMRSVKLGDRLVRMLAHIHDTTPAAFKAQIFPERVARLTTSDSVDMAALGQMAPDLARATMKQPNVTNVDVAAIHAGRVRAKDQLKLSTVELGKHASSIVRAVLPEPADSGPVAATTEKAIANRYSIKAKNFFCVEESSEWSASDEVYWLFASVAKGYQMSAGTHTFNGVDKNEVLNFENDEGCIWGMDCQPHSFPDGEIGTVVTLIEHDQGDQSDVLAGWNAAWQGATAILAASNVAAWVAAVVAAVGGIGAVIIECMADDHIADASWTFNRALINEVVDKHGGFYDTTQHLTDGDADYKLRIRVARVA